MGLMDKAKDMAAGQEGKTDAAIDKAGDMADEKTGGKHSDNVDQAQQKADDAIG